MSVLSGPCISTALTSIMIGLLSVIMYNAALDWVTLVEQLWVRDIRTVDDTNKSFAFTPPNKTN